MFKKTLAVVATALVLSVSSIAAQASTTFDFRSWRGPTASFNMNVDGIGLNVSAGTFSNGGTVTPGGLVGTAPVTGLGVINGFDNPQVDGFWGNDVAIFDFTQQVKFESISFFFGDDNDEFTFFVGDPLVSQGFNFALNADLAAAEYISNMFGIGALDNNDEFTIASISVSAVPLPSSVLLFGGALLGMGWLSRRKLKSTATA